MEEETKILDNGIVLRPWKDEDEKPMEEIIRKTWWESDEISPGMQDRISITFLLESLREQSFICVAEEDGVPIGCIMGSDIRHRHSSLSENWRLFMSALGILMKSEGRRLLRSVGGEGLNHKALDEKGGNLSYDGEVVFFILDDSARGKGVGKALYDELMDYFRSSGVKTWRVYTDTDCSYGFYEHMGCTRRSEIRQTYELGDGKEGHITYFLYDHGVAEA